MRKFTIEKTTRRAAVGLISWVHRGWRATAPGRAMYDEHRAESQP